MFRVGISSPTAYGHFQLKEKPEARWKRFGIVPVSAAP